MIFFDIDTQADFMRSSGALCVPGAESIEESIGRLLRAAGENGIVTISTRCAHTPDDAEFALFPPHCIEGTPGAERIFAELPALPRREVSADAEAEAGGGLAPGTHYIVSKRVFDLFSNRWLEGLRQQGIFGGEECVVFGVATDYCVRECVFGLVKAGARVRVVADAIAGVAATTTDETLSAFDAAGVGTTTTEEVLARLSTIES